MIIIAERTIRKRPTVIVFEILKVYANMYIVNTVTLLFVLNRRGKMSNIRCITMSMPNFQSKMHTGNEDLELNGGHIF